ncbi:MAG: hypothetical protein ACEQSR_01270 [Candidatus Methylacidiphilales bacterium]
MVTYSLTSFIFLVAVYILLDAFRDDIVHHNAYKHWGYFFSKEAAEAAKTTFLHRFFPMFFDAWHGAKFVQYVCIAAFLGLLFNSVLVFVLALFSMSLLFLIAYSYND